MSKGIILTILIEILNKNMKHIFNEYLPTDFEEKKYTPSFEFQPNYYDSAQLLNSHISSMTIAAFLGGEIRRELRNSITRQVTIYIDSQAAFKAIKSSSSLKHVMN